MRGDSSLSDDRMKIGLYTTSYNRIAELPRFLRQVPDDINVYVVDGAMKWEDELLGIKEPLSTDGSREFLLKRKNTKIIDLPWKLHWEKLNAGLKACADDGCDLALWMDTDAYLVGDWELFRLRAKVMCNNINGYGYWLPTYYQVADPFYRHVYVNCAFWRPEKCEYKYLHHAIFADGKRIMPRFTATFPIINGLLLVHDKQCTFPQNFKDMEKWKARYFKYEDEMLELHREELTS